MTPELAFGLGMSAGSLVTWAGIWLVHAAEGRRQSRYIRRAEQRHGGR